MYDASFLLLIISPLLSECFVPRKSSMVQALESLNSWLLPRLEERCGLLSSDFFSQCLRLHAPW
jgi:hypothetical protein